MIIELGDDEKSPDSKAPYPYTVIGYPSRAYVWIMAREKTMDSVLYESVLKRLKEVHGYDLEGLIKMEHSP